MNHQITCQCGHIFDVTLPDCFDLDTEPERFEQLMDGTFLSFSCPSCGNTLKPELELHIQWPSKGMNIHVLPELDRASYEGIQKSSHEETVFGYPEAADRVAIYRDGLNPVVIEALKYYLLLKAEETNPDAEALIWYQEKGTDSLVFHVHGLREDEVAVSRVPLGVYEKTLNEYREDESREPFKSLCSGSYISVQNLLAPGDPS